LASPFPNPPAALAKVRETAARAALAVATGPQAAVQAAAAQPARPATVAPAATNVARQAATSVATDSMPNPAA
jgi:hypothetical protein